MKQITKYDFNSDKKHIQLQGQKIKARLIEIM